MESGLVQNKEQTHMVAGQIILLSLPTIIIARSLKTNPTPSNSP